MRPALYLRLRADRARAVSFIRKTLVDVVLSDGTRIPRDTVFGGNVTSVHTSADTYARPLAFEPWRYSDLRKEGEASRLQYANTSLEFMPWGLGAHAWYVRPRS